MERRITIKITEETDSEECTVQFCWVAHQEVR